MVHANFDGATNVIKNTYTVTCILEAVMTNPNGDPDMGNTPRQDIETGIGVITDVALKRRIRDYVEEAYGEEAGMEILMRNGVSVNKEIAKAVLEVNGLQKFSEKFTNPKVRESADFINQKFWDARTFGAVLATGRNGGQVNGPVQFGIAMSVDPIHIEDMTITRMCYADGKDFTTIEEYEKEEAERPQDKKRTMGNKKVISYGLYIVQATISPSLAAKTGFTERDLQILFEAMLQMYDFNNTASKQGMRMASPLIIFKHVGTHPENPDEAAKEALLGCAPAHRLYNMLHVTKKGTVEFPRSFDDYEIALKVSEIEKAAASGVQIGFKDLPFADVVWEQKNPDEFANIAKENNIQLV